ncbi:hypothetical protein [Natrinema salsiterrestre]|uniref:Uncharacterized protein n=1 Tax=Natrinema salsiterrestre TaxID=2950540 RepID=A0A9Q4L0H5_9EURY|nr:hypothetical protein [Natrinema salsiterrestre]MDF9747578.1 hypothetical protein [Natrinema salsiterrestre]
MRNAISLLLSNNSLERIPNDMSSKSPIKYGLECLSVVSVVIGFGGLLVLPSVSIPFEHSILGILGYDGSTTLPYLITLGAWILAIITHILIRRLEGRDER